MNAPGAGAGGSTSLTRGPFPSDAADRMADFAELLATAVGDAHDRAELAASRPKHSADRLRFSSPWWR